MHALQTNNLNVCAFSSAQRTPYMFGHALKFDYIFFLQYDRFEEYLRVSVTLSNTDVQGGSQQVTMSAKATSSSTPSSFEIIFQS